MKTIHGHTKRLPGGGRVNSPEYRAFTAMKNRCLNENQARHKDYGGRGIAICDRWLHGEAGRSGFQCFLSDVGPKPTSDHSLDRRDNSRGYEPNNVRWATPEQQARNARSNRIVDIGLGPMTFSEAVEKSASGISAATARMRVHRGWDDETAILTPPNSSPISPEVTF